MTNSSAAMCFLLAALSAGAIGGYFVGRVQGAAAERSTQNAQTVADLNNIIDASNALINDSNAASKRMREALALRSIHDSKTTQEIKNALAKTAGSRADCRFDDDIMRNLAEARDRAAAAAAGGIRNPVPAAGGSGQQSR
jgi:hypothetical protein